MTEEQVRRRLVVAGSGVGRLQRLPAAALWATNDEPRSRCKASTARAIQTRTSPNWVISEFTHPNGRCVTKAQVVSSVSPKGSTTMTFDDRAMRSLVEESDDLQRDAMTASKACADELRDIGSSRAAR